MDDCSCEGKSVTQKVRLSTQLHRLWDTPVDGIKTPGTSQDVMETAHQLSGRWILYRFYPQLMSQKLGLPSLEAHIGHFSRNDEGCP